MFPCRLACGVRYVGNPHFRSTPAVHAFRFLFSSRGSVAAAAFPFDTRDTSASTSARLTSVRPFRRHPGMMPRKTHLQTVAEQTFARFAAWPVVRVSSGRPATGVVSMFRICVGTMSNHKPVGVSDGAQQNIQAERLSSLDVLTSLNVWQG